jgi:pyruvate,water dikinase
MTNEANVAKDQAYVVPFEQLRMTDVDIVGGKNASLGEMISQLAEAGVQVPTGFATTAQAFRDFLHHNSLTERIAKRLELFDVDDVKALAEAGKEIRQWIVDAPMQPRLEELIRKGFDTLQASSPEELSFAVRSSATAEDLPDASFAGQQESYLNVVGIEEVLDRMKHVFASLYNDRAISYRVHKGFTHAEVALSAGVQRMVRSDVGAAGVMFTLDTESGFKDAVFITSSYGLGETVVQGAVNPDEFYVFKTTLEQGKYPIIRRSIGSKLIKMEFTSAGEAGRVKTVDVSHEQRNRFSITDEDVIQLAKYAVIIEKHYQRPMDIEWGKDGRDGKIFILQARPETVKSQNAGKAEMRFKLKGQSQVLATGRAIGQKIGAGPVRVIHDPSEMDRVQPGDVLVADMTDPNWEPVMKRASAIVTNRGGRTCHAAIIARELGVPAVVGCGDATDLLKEGQLVTVSCAEGDEGKIYDGLLETEVTEVERGELPEIPVKIMMNVGNPQLAFDFSHLPNAGVGLARLEFIINNNIGVHPKAILEYPNVDADLKKAVESVARGHASPRAFYVDKLTEGIATIAAAFYPKPVIVRRSLPDGMYRVEEGARRDGPRQRRDHGAVCAHAGAGREGGRPAREVRPEARCERLAAYHDVRDSVERDPCRRVPAILRRFLDRIERPDAAHAGPGPRFGHGVARGRFRRTRPGCAVHAEARDRNVSATEQVRGHLRSGSVGSPGSRRMAREARHRVDVAESGHDHRHVEDACSCIE